MSRRNSRQAKAMRRKDREVRHVGGCSLCGSKDVEWCSEHDAADPSYRAVCLVHLCYAVSTIFMGENPGPVDLPASWFDRARARRHRNRLRLRHLLDAEEKEPLPIRYRGPRVPLPDVTTSFRTTKT